MGAERADNSGTAGVGVSDAVLIAVARREAEVALRARSHQPLGGTPGCAGSRVDSGFAGQDPSPVDAADTTPVGEAPGSCSGTVGSLPASFAGYQILREVHRGGQGVVYQAIQSSTKRMVALKVLREGVFATPGEQARFEREVEILGQLNHPNIVAIHDRAHVAGRHYFVMDYIQGEPLDTWLAKGTHAVEETLRLFAKICHAVNAAHLLGFTHRDLKPGNIRVDERGEPHILDFGLARVALGPESPDSGTPAMTLTGQFIGSVPWASPEQAEGMPAKIDLRTDVYSLGVILYQMLTGAFPYKTTGNMHDVLARIIQAEPVRPRKLRQSINDEVETIVLKCLSKERERRYQSAGELARDVDRYLAGDPVEAKRDSALYVLRKQLGRYRLPVAVGVAFLLVLLAGAAVSLGLWRQAVAERASAEQARLDAEDRRAAAEASEVTARAETARADREAAAARKQAAIAEAERVLISEMLAKADRGGAHGDPTVTVRELMDRAARELATAQTPYAPEVEAALRATIGRTYVALGLFNQAEPHLRAALELRRSVFGEKHLGVAESLEAVALLAQSRGDYAGAEPLFREVLETRRELLGEEHAAVATSLNHLGALLKDKGDYAAAEPLLIQALDLTRRLYGDGSVDVAASQSNLAALLREKGDYAQAAALLRDALAVLRKFKGDEDPHVAADLSNLAMVVRRQGNLAEAETLYRQALALQRKLVGDEHPSVATIMGNLGGVLQVEGQYAEAEALLTAALEMDRRLFGDTSPAIAADLNNLAELRRVTGDFAAAEPLYREALALQRDLFGDEHGVVAATLNNLGLLLLAKGDFAAAEPLLREALALFRKVFGDEHPRVATSLNNLARLLFQRGEYTAAEPLFREALAIDQKRPSPNVAVIACTGLGRALVRLGRWSEAEPLLLEAQQRALSAHCPERFRDAAFAALVDLHRRWHAAVPGQGHDRQAAMWQQQRVEWRASTRPTTQPDETYGWSDN